MTAVPSFVVRVVLPDTAAAAARCSLLVATIDDRTSGAVIPGST